MAKQRDLSDLFINELQDVYHAEGQLVKALPKMAKASTDPALRQGFERHLKETEAQVERLESVFKLIGEKAKRKTCHAMQGLIDEGKEWMGEDAEDDVMDAGLIAAAQKVEHYEIATYGCLVTWAKQLDFPSRVVQLLTKTLEEEKATDEKLTALAESRVNLEAAAGA